ncbi:MAG TPA: CBS domain-containing protein [Polyangiales bacterium]|nr:CBS domain-containing protein [Polyangiales bacterium]
MATYTQGKQLHEIAVADVCSRELHLCHSDDAVSDAVNTMAIAQVRRLPVLDVDGRLVGVLSLNDLIRHAWTDRLRGHDEDPHLAVLLESVSRPRTQWSDALPPMSDAQREHLAVFDAL